VCNLLLQADCEGPIPHLSCSFLRHTDVPTPQLVRLRGEQLGLGCIGDSTDVAPLAILACGIEDPVHRAQRAQVLAFLEQLRVDLRYGEVSEARLVQRSEDSLAIGLGERTAARATPSRV